jgi:uncharacterized phage protein (TIGR01671 family)
MVMIMKDRYLYKAKRIDNGEWVVGSLISMPYGGYMIDRVVDSRRFRVMINPSTICQCTGLKDKNNNLIWENDIIHKPFYTDYDAYANSEAYTGRIQYEDGGWSVEITKPDGNVCVSPIIEMIAYSKDIEYCEVIGNIFDNPELNKREKTYCKDSNDFER